MSDRLIDYTGGYGNVYKTITKDPNLSIEAKGIYAYLSSYAGGKDVAFPSISLICHELNISEKRFYKHRKELIDKNIISVHRERTNNGFSKSIYTINHHFVHSQNVHVQNDNVRNESVQNVHVQNVGTKKNNIKKNKEKKNSSSSASTTKQQPPSHSYSNVFNFYQENGFGILQPFVVDQIDNWIEDFNGNEHIVIEALKEAATNNVCKWSYANSILKSWYQDGIKSIDDIEARRKQREASKNKTESTKTFDNSQYADLF
ncbi:DnaD domain protein [Staphylococcus hominis]|uniref:DnaD domain protein n=1 Tax=Staphylococcus hominis TaxID=1290 RepID=UPI0007657DB1|nr:DnaD domain protein [Staphylococcus hominis]CVY65278.1 DNA replication protein [Staphylococcus hominis]